LQKCTEAAALTALDKVKYRLGETSNEDLLVLVEEVAASAALP
jgi:hypothetical protein